MGLQMLDLDHGICPHDIHCPFNHVLKLPDIARPIIRFKKRDNFIRQFFYIFTQSGIMFPNKMIHTIRGVGYVLKPV